MPGGMSLAYYTPSAYAVIGGQNFDISAVRVDFAINTIPQCVLSLPLGREMRTNNPATIHQLAGQMGTQLPIQVYANFNPADLSDPSLSTLGIPAGPVKIFDGFTSAGGFSRNVNGATYTLYANGALCKLNQASALSDSAMPGNPDRFSWGAIVPDPGDVGAQDWTVVTKASKYINSGNIMADLWGKSFYPWFTALTKQNGLWFSQKTIKVEPTNKQAAAALKLLAPQGSAYKPLAVLSSIYLGVDAAQAIAADVAMLTHDATFTANQTLWDILVGHFAAEYGFAVIPRVSGGLVAPYVGGYRGSNGPYLTISAGEYELSEHTRSMPRPIRGFGVLSAIATRAGSSGFLNDAVDWSKTGFGGWYDAGANIDGAVMIQNAPRWMGFTLAPSSYSAVSTGAGGKTVSSAMSPRAGTTNNSRQRSRTNRTQTVKPLLDAFAQVRYAQEVLKGRALVLSGPFRLDIAPGSLVGIEGAGEQFLDSDQLAANLYGDVQVVSLTLDAERKTCGTSFHIGNVRTEAENNTNQASIPRHPLFANTFLGCALNDAAGS